MKVDRSFESWLEMRTFDPFTNYLDFSAFRIDLYKTTDGYLVEAVLEEADIKEYKLTVKDAELSIQFLREDEILERKVYFPESILFKPIQASLKNSIIEVRIFT
ncbi:hypothetical protein [Peribacillus kribbensis]|uniref:hypothetical protein n=1 Tax=Peribacillus kribbensis TaxID=356658 RepID=UPI0003F77A77|nr:hypothetical protein [Peribacillus kribbensis]